ncbi:MAG TPA: hypothetical protein VFE03_00970 [Caulobacteraceae bacterium]|jgi:hypothetical protein|nr:hypothetical protein [Caulobacteraceae bacterium]
MADNSGGGGANAFLAFLVGGLIVVVAVIGVAMYGGFTPPAKPVDVRVSVPQPSLPNAPSVPNPAPAPTPTPVPTPGR